MMPELTIGVDLAQAFDYTGLVALEHGGGEPPTYTARMIERWRHRSYTALPELVQRAETQLRRLAAQEYRATYGDGIDPWRDVGVTLVLDSTGVGAAVTDLLLDAGLSPVPIIISGGFTVTARAGRGYVVPKLHLVTAVQLLLEGRRLRIPAELPHAQTLTRELQNFRYEISPGGHVRYGAGAAGEDVAWRGDGSHDDLLLATACAAWHAETQRPVALDPLLAAAWDAPPGGNW